MHVRDLGTNAFSLNQKCFSTDTLNKCSVRCARAPDPAEVDQGSQNLRPWGSHMPQGSPSFSSRDESRKAQQGQSPQSGAWKPWARLWELGVWDQLLCAGELGCRCWGRSREAELWSGEPWQPWWMIRKRESTKNVDFTQQLLGAVKLFPGGSFTCWDCPNEKFSQFPVRGKLKI